MCVLVCFVHDVEFAEKAGRKLHRLVPATALVLAKVTLKSDDANFQLDFRTRDSDLDSYKQLHSVIWFRLPLSLLTRVVVLAAASCRAKKMTKFRHSGQWSQGLQHFHALRLALGGCILCRISTAW